MACLDNSGNPSFQNPVNTRGNSGKDLSGQSGCGCDHAWRHCLNGLLLSLGALHSGDISWAVVPMALQRGYECLPRKYVCGVVPSIVRNISMKALTLS